jgi:hypothetical protein
MKSKKPDMGHKQEIDQETVICRMPSGWAQPVSYTHLTLPTIYSV